MYAHYVTELFKSRAARALILSALALGACGDDDGDDNAAADSGTQAPIDGGVSTLDSGLDANVGANDGGQTTAPPPANALYAISTWITANEVTSAYTKLVPSLDSETKVDIKTDAIESPGYGGLKVANGKVFTSSGEAPIITGWTLDGSGKLVKDAKTVNFMASSMAAPLYRVTFVSPTVAYLTGDSSWVRWNPTTMEIDPSKEIKFPTDKIAVREGINPFYSFDRGVVSRGNRIYQSIYWTDFTNYKMTATSAIAVIDTDSSTLLKVLDTKCPGLDSATLDEAGNIYFSGWAYNPGATVVNNAPKGCAEMIPAGKDELDPDFKLTFSDFTGGHEAIGLRYIGKGKFLMDVFHEEKQKLTDNTAIGTWLFANSWLYAIYDSATHKYTELPGLGYHSGGYYSEIIDGKFYLLTRNAGGDTEYTQLQDDGTAKKGITVDGWSTSAYRVR